MAIGDLAAPDGSLLSQTALNPPLPHLSAVGTKLPVALQGAAAADGADDAGGGIRPRCDPGRFADGRQRGAGRFHLGGQVGYVAGGLAEGDDRRHLAASLPVDAFSQPRRQFRLVPVQVGDQEVKAVVVLVDAVAQSVLGLDEAAQFLAYILQHHHPAHHVGEAGEGGNGLPPVPLDGEKAEGGAGPSLVGRGRVEKVAQEEGFEAGGDAPSVLIQPHVVGRPLGLAQAQAQRFQQECPDRIALLDRSIEQRGQLVVE